MKIGFKFSLPLGSLKTGQNRYFIGDEISALGIRKELLKFPEVEYCELFNSAPPFKLDAMVYFNEDEPQRNYAYKSILYFQNAFPQGNEKMLKIFQARKYDGYMFTSKKLLELHKSLSFDGIYLPSATDPEYMRPMVPSKKYQFDVAYVGNNIKGTERTIKYIYPAAKFNFGLFGVWEWGRRVRFISRPKRILQRISKGRIPYEDLPVLYSSVKIVLNCTLQEHVYWDTISGRVYDALACNALVISDALPPDECNFKDNVIVSSGGKDLEKKIKYYLEHGDERIKIASQGRNLILQNHTWKHRAKVILEYFKKIL